MEKKFPKEEEKKSLFNSQSQSPGLKTSSPAYYYRQPKQILTKQSLDQQKDVLSTLRTSRNLSEERVLRGMIIENLTQRANEFKEEIENLVVVKNNLIRNKILLDDNGKIIACPPSGHAGENIQKGVKDFQPEYGSLRQIVLWLDNNTGEVMKKSKVGDLLSIYDNLSPELSEKATSYNIYFMN